MRTLLTSLLAVVLCAGAAFGQADVKKAKVLYFTNSCGFEHDMVKYRDGGPSVSDEVFTKIGKAGNVEVVCTKDGKVFDGDLDQYDAFIFYTSGNLLGGTKDKPESAISKEGMEKLFAAIRGGKGFFGLHSASDTLRTGGDAYKNSDPEKVTEYIKMVGGEFTTHGNQQDSTLLVVQPCGFKKLAAFGEKFKYYEEWYCHKNYNEDMHVIAIMDPVGMKGDMYQRPPCPIIWARMEGKGRVLFNAMGHRKEFWDDPKMVEVLAEQLDWVLGRFDTDVKPNFKEVTPQGSVLKNAE